MYPKIIKPFLDIALAALMLLILWPILLIIAAAVRLQSKGPALFPQRRIGKNKVVFKMYKFRTMRTDAPSDMPTHLLNNPYAFITPLGRVLRKTSLDELPQLLNILMGHMSFVGPRPALWNQDDLIACRDTAGANSIKPGLTGWAQISGRDELAISVKARLDGEYAKKISFAFDISILLKTFISVFKREGIAEGKRG